MVDPQLFEDKIREKYQSILYSVYTTLNENSICATSLKYIKTRVKLLESMAAAEIIQNDEVVGIIISRPDYKRGVNLFKVIDGRGPIIEGEKPKFFWMLPELPKKLEWKSHITPGLTWSFEVSVRDIVPELTQIYSTPTPLNGTEIVINGKFSAWSRGPLLFGATIYSATPPYKPLLKISPKQVLFSTKIIRGLAIDSSLHPEVVLSILAYAFFYSKEFR